MSKLRAKKSFGQHFLNNEQMALRIVESLTDNILTKKVLEVGPGPGVLTKHLLSKDLDLKVVELDRDMVAHLKVSYPALDQRIIELDFLKADLDSVFDGDSFGLIGNYPYNISSQILFKMVENRDKIPLMVGMFQKEVADRVCAPHGNKVYGVISILIQAYYDCEYLFKVSPGSFNPPPKVMSAVIRLKRKEKMDLACDPSLFKSIVKISFNQRRKMLRNTLKSFIKDDEVLKEALFSKRPEQLSVEDFVSLTLRIQNQK